MCKEFGPSERCSLSVFTFRIQVCWTEEKMDQRVGVATLSAHCQPGSLKFTVSGSHDGDTTGKRVGEGDVEKLW